MYLPSLRNTITLSMLEHLETNSSFLRAVPINPSFLFIKSFWFATTTLLAEIESNCSIADVRFLLSPYLIIKFSKYSIA